jgi:hypothetical protein
MTYQCVSVDALPNCSAQKTFSRIPNIQKLWTWALHLMVSEANWLEHFEISCLPKFPEFAIVQKIRRAFAAQEAKTQLRMDGDSFDLGAKLHKKADKQPSKSDQFPTAQNDQLLIYAKFSRSPPPKCAIILFKLEKGGAGLIQPVLRISTLTVNDKWLSPKCEQCIIPSMVAAFFLLISTSKKLAQIVVDGHLSLSVNKFSKNWLLCSFVKCLFGRWKARPAF